MIPLVANGTIDKRRSLNVSRQPMVTVVLVPMNPVRFGPGSFRPGSFRPNFGMGRFGLGRGGRFGPGSFRPCVVSAEVYTKMQMA